MEKKAKEILKKYQTGSITDEERMILESWYLEKAKSSEAISLDDKELEADLLKINEALISSIKAQRKTPVIRYIKYAASAAAILLIVGAAFFFFQKYSVSNNLISKTTKEILPGSNKAILTLDDNSEIVLDNMALGEVASYAGIKVEKTADGQLQYIIEDKGEGEELKYNTISTPKGGEYSVTLSDGTLVRLNSLSSIRIPSFFEGNERRVEITGEAYFEVAKNPKKPFIVKSGKQTLEVLGTHFNINNFGENNTVKTTLIEGSVKLYANNKNDFKLLKPGQQSVLPANSNEFNVENIDIEEAVAWKNGYFLFVDEDLESIMNKLSRWYDVEVEYKGAKSKSKFGGSISRSKNLSQVLNVLEVTGNVKFKVNGRRIIVMS